MIKRWLSLGLTGMMLSLPLSGAWALDEDLEALLKSVPTETVDGRTVLKVDLKTLLKVALQRSIEIQASGMGEEIAKRGVTATAEGLYTPKLSTSLGYGKQVELSSGKSSLAAQLQANPSYTSIGSGEGFNANATYSKKLESGMSYSLSYTEQRQQGRSGSIAEEGDDPQLGTYGDWADKNNLTAALEIPLHKNRGAEINNLPVRVAELEIDRSRLNDRQKKLDLLKLIAQTYWDLVGILENIYVQENAVTLSERLLKDNQVRLETGVLSEPDVRITETQLARERQTLLARQIDSLRIEDQVRSALNLEQLEVGFRPVDVPQVRQNQFDFNQYLEKVYTNDTKLASFQVLLRGNDYTQLQLHNDEKSEVNFKLSYVLNGHRSEVLEGVQQFSEPDLHGYNASLVWAMPLFDKATPEKLQKSRLERQQIELQINSLKSQLSVQLQTILRSMRLAVKEVETARVAMNLAARQLQDEIERFQLGKSTSFQVSQFQQQAAQAQLQEIQARLGYEKNLLELLVLSGELFPYFQLN